MIEWKDITSYSAGERGIKEPTTWETRLMNNVRVVITCSHIYHRPAWVMHCAALSMECVPLGMEEGAPLEEVKDAALVAAQDQSNAVRYALQDALHRTAMAKLQQEGIKT